MSAKELTQSLELLGSYCRTPSIAEDLSGLARAQAWQKLLAHIAELEAFRAKVQGSPIRYMIDENGWQIPVYSVPVEEVEKP